MIAEKFAKQHRFWEQPSKFKLNEIVSKIEVEF